MINKGDQFGSSDWTMITQDMINDFARVTGDNQWIHVDTERAARQLPGKSTIAHGLLITSLFPKWLRIIRPGFDFAVNAKRTLIYGFNKVRFITPVPAYSRVRAHFVLNDYETTDSGTNAYFGITVELENSPKPAVVAELIIRYQN